MTDRLSPLLLIHALTGKTLCLNVHPDVMVSDVKAVLVQALMLPKEDQILMLRTGTRLENGKSLGHYGLPDYSDECTAPVFIFSRDTCAGVREESAADLDLGRILAAEPLHTLPTDLTTYLSIPEIDSDSLAFRLSTLQISMSVVSEESLSSLKELFAYELQFEDDSSLAKRHWDTCIEQLAVSKALLSELDSQGQAIDAARASLEAEMSSILSAGTSFLKRYAEQHSSHQKLLDTHSADLNALTQIKVHPGLQNALAKNKSDISQDAFKSLSLADILPVSKMRQCQEKCMLNHTRFAERVSDLSSSLLGLQTEVNDFLSVSATLDLGPLLQVSLPRAERACDDLSFLVQAFTKDRSMAKDAIQRWARGFLSNTVSAASTAADDVQALKMILSGHFDTLCHVSSFGSTTLSFLRECGNYKSRLTRALGDQLGKISGLLAKFRDIKMQCFALEEVFKSQSDAFDELRMSKRVPSAYRLLLSECMRQSAYSKVIQSVCHAAQEILDTMASRERESRVDMAKRLALYLPQDLIDLAGLSDDSLESAKATMGKANSSLLDVTLQDLPSALPKLQQETSMLNEKKDKTKAAYVDIMEGIDRGAIRQVNLANFFSNKFTQELSLVDDDIRQGLAQELQLCFDSKDREIEVLKKKIVEQHKRIDDLEAKVTHPLNHAYGPIALAAGVSRPSSPFVSSLDVMHLQRLNHDSNSPSVMIAGFMDISN